MAMLQVWHCPMGQNVPVPRRTKNQQEDASVLLIIADEATQNDVVLKVLHGT